MTDPATLVQFGAGNVGRGFIAPIFSAGGWSVAFVDIDAQRVAQLQRRRSYQVIEVDNACEHAVVIDAIDAIHACDFQAVVAAVAGCALAATAVGLAALPQLALCLAAGIRERQQRGRRPLDILVCENGVQAHHVLKDAVLSCYPPAERAAASAAFAVVRTSIGRMIPGNRAEDPLDIRVEPYARLQVEGPAFRNRPPDLPNLAVCSDFDLVLGQKLYLHNLTHACIAYAGHLKGIATIPECLDDAELADAVARAGAEAGAALARAHARDAQHHQAIVDQCARILSELLARYRNRALNDTVARVARDPWRKLAAQDRLIGAARLCLDSGVQAPAIHRHILGAFRYHPSPDEPQAERWLHLQGHGLATQLRVVAGLQDGDALFAALMDADRLSSGSQRHPGHGSQGRSRRRGMPPGAP